MRKIVIDELTLQRDLAGGMNLPSGDDLPYSDGIPLESPWHRDGMMILLDQIEKHLLGRNDFYAGGDMFVHYSLKKDKRTDFRGPDVFVVFDVPREPDRKSWVVWEEDWHYPDIVVEILSESTESIDRVEKFALYRDVWKTTEYFLFDFETMKAEGWRLENGKYQSIQPNSNGHIECQQLGLWLGGAEIVWRGRRQSLPALFESGGQFAPTFELQALQLADAAKLKASDASQTVEAANRRADALERIAAESVRRADIAQELAEVAKQVANAAAQRADALQAELDLLRAKLNTTGTPNAT
jgi:Uma2 family endonuclease